ncbi:hypothetical protein E2P81_ATG04726 [Venturia nashicola]|uniref:Cytidyltransferase-like domain-containing protein n=1 Tax=Venturia nashicola TaxID=86259 RepID=A0A4Z1PEW2_9PEZI|nr:hypothetical protein E6O75_ATG04840 [Venturia nashicola]TLD34561.1 hypothetical protein E2P81_ATG04726 [Venturia nashicola]
MPLTQGLSNVASSKPIGDAPPSSDCLQYYMNAVYSNRIKATNRTQPYFSARPSIGLLDRGRVNRVLLFDGCFDPPHVAHLKLLKYVYTQARTRLNIVGAVILPWSEHSCNTVARNRENRAIWNNDPPSEGHHVHFPLAERMKMWSEDPDFPAWASVLDIAVWDVFRDQLIKATSFEGYELRFTLLRGMDHLRLGMRVFHALNTNEIISSDITRKAEFVTKDGLLRLSKGATPWTIWDVKESLQAAKTVKVPEEGRIMLVLPSKEMLTYGGIEVAPFYFCRVNGTQDLVLYIAKPEEENGNEHGGLSSTHIRSMMKMGHIEEHAITGEVASLVLGPHRSGSSR